MSNRYQTKGIVLKRIDYGEADRIITFFTEDRGKVTVMAKGVRRPKSKLAGGIELFSVCNIGGIVGKRDIDTLTSTRLETYFENIVKDYDRLQVAYDMLKLIDKMTDDDAGGDYFNLLVDSLKLLDEERAGDEVVACWFYMQSMRLNGSLPNLLEDIHGTQLDANTCYTFSVEDGGFFKSEAGTFCADDIKAWRVFGSANTRQIKQVRGLGEPARKSLAVIKHFAEYQV